MKVIRLIEPFFRLLLPTFSCRLDIYVLVSSWFSCLPFAQVVFELFFLPSCPRFLGSLVIEPLAIFFSLFVCA